MSTAAAETVKVLIPMSSAFKRIATEEAYAPAEMLQRYRKLIDEKGTTDPGFLSQWPYFLGNATMMQKLATRFTDVGEGRIRCAIKAPGSTEVAQTPHLRATYPRSSEELDEQPTFETILAEFSSHGDSLAVLEFQDLFQHGFANEKGIKVEWPKFREGEERWDFFLPSGPPQEDLELPFAVVWRTTAIPAAKISCSLETSAGTATVRTQGGLSHRSEPIAE